jgi:hypothetical protein
MPSFDPNMPLEAACAYFFTTGKTTWQQTGAETLAQMLQSSNPPEFKSVLGIMGVYDEDKPRDEINYLGSLYLDLDGDIDEAIKDFQLGSFRKSCWRPALGLRMRAFTGIACAHDQPRAGLAFSDTWRVTGQVSNMICEKSQH